MSSTQLQESIAFCGLVCGLCDHIGSCSCKAPIKAGDKCDKEYCPHRSCCLNNGLEGCWECSAFPCDKGRFSDENRGQTLGFLQYIRDFGKAGFINRLRLNQENGIQYGMGGAYRHKSYEEVNRLLRDGE